MISIHINSCQFHLFCLHRPGHSRSQYGIHGLKKGNGSVASGHTRQWILLKIQVQEFLSKNSSWWLSGYKPHHLEGPILLTKNHPSWSKVQSTLEKSYFSRGLSLQSKHWHNILSILGLFLGFEKKNSDDSNRECSLLVIVLTFMLFDLSCCSWQLSSQLFGPQKRNLSVLTLPSSSIPSKAGQCGNVAMSNPSLQKNTFEHCTLPGSPEPCEPWPWSNVGQVFRMGISWDDDHDQVVVHSKNLRPPHQRSHDTKMRKLVFVCL